MDVYQAGLSGWIEAGPAAYKASLAACPTVRRSLSHGNGQARRLTRQARRLALRCSARCHTATGKPGGLQGKPGGLPYGAAIALTPQRASPAAYKASPAACPTATPRGAPANCALLILWRAGRASRSPPPQQRSTWSTTARGSSSRQRGWPDRRCRRAGPAAC